MNIVRMQVNHIENPLGFDLGACPTFSWVVEDTEATCAVASRVVVRQEGTVVADTSWAALDAKACPLDIDLLSRTRYEWTVSVRADTGVEATSAPAWFETAKLDEPWEADWITCDYAEPRHPVFCKRLGLAQDDVATARLYVCGLGVYEATIDGTKVGNEHLAPGTHAYDRWLQYQTYDVSDQVKNGSELAIALGHGWYSGRFGFVMTDKGHYGSDWRLIAELHVTFADGSEQVMGTDDSWLVTRSTTCFSNIYDGEVRDDTLPETAPVPAELVAQEEAERSLAKLEARLSPPVVACETMAPTLIRTPAGECVLDLGQEITGTFRLRNRWPKGTVVRVQTAELLQDGNFYRDNLRTARSEFVYTSDGTEKLLEPRFTFYGYRYARISVDGKSPEDFDAADFTGVVWHSDFDYRRGRITCGHSKVNRLIENARWGMRDNFLDTPTDCPQRDERMGWTGDANVFSRTALLLGAPYAFFRKYLHDMALEQKTWSGGVPMVIPSFGIGPAPAVWADATTFIPWNMWRLDGDPSILAEHFDAMRSYVDWAHEQDGTDHALMRSHQLGDWLALDSTEPSGRLGATDGGFIAYVYLWQSARIVAETARILGRDEDACRYDEMAAATKAWIETEYLTATGRPAVTTMTAYVLCLSFGLGNADFCTRRLRQLLKDNDGHLTSGFVGTPLLCPALSDAGLDAEAYTLLLKEDYPSWLFEVDLGATTIWERWNSLDADGHITGIEMNSMNHYAYGSIVEWLFTHSAGIQAQEPGFSRALIHPRPNWTLRILEAELDSAAGTWRVSWECVGESRLRVSVTVPFGATAEVVLPHAPVSAYHALGGHVLTAGTYEVTYDTTRLLRRVPSVDWTLAQIMDTPDVAAVVRPFVDGFDFAMLTSDMGLTLREAQVAGLGQNERMSAEQLEACDAALRKLAE